MLKWSYIAPPHLAVCINEFYCWHLFQKSQEREESGSDDQLAFEEFVHYLQDYEKDLKLVVKSINKKNAGLWLGTKFHLCLIWGV